jgi:hypothetical protein
MQGEGQSGPHGEVGAGLMIRMPTNPRVGRAWPGPSVLVDDAELFVVEEPGMVTEDAVDHIDQERMVDRRVGSWRHLGGKADVVGERTTIDGGPWIVEDGGPMTVGQGPCGQVLLDLGQFVLDRCQLGFVEGTAEDGIAVSVEPVDEAVEVVGSEGVPSVAYGHR